MRRKFSILSLALLSAFCFLPSAARGQTGPGQQLCGATPLPFGSTVNIPASMQNCFQVTLTGNVSTSNLDFPYRGEWIYLTLIQDSVGGRSFTPPYNTLNWQPIDTRPFSDTPGSTAGTTTEEGYFDGTYWQIIGGYQSSGGSTPPCSTTVQGSLSVIPQTCAGEKTLQGISGNPTDINFHVIPAPDQRAENIYFGPPDSSFSGTYIPGDIDLAWNAITTLNQGKTGSPGPWSAGLTVVNEDNNPSDLGNYTNQAVVGAMFSADQTGGSTGSSNYGSMHFCYQDDGTSLECDAIGAFVYVRNGTVTEETAGLLVGDFSYGLTSNVASNKAVRVNHMAGVAPVPLDNYAFWYAGLSVPDFLDSYGNEYLENNMSVGSIAINTACIGAGSAGTETCGTSSYGKIETVIAAGSTSQIVEVAPLYAHASIVVQEDQSLGADLSVTCNTTVARTYAITAKTTGEIWRATERAEGSGYANGDTGNVNGGTGGTYLVTSTAAGKVTGFTISAPGTDYVANPKLALSTTATSGVGTGFTIVITEVGGSFTVTSSAAPITNPACLSIVPVN